MSDHLRSLLVTSGLFPWAMAGLMILILLWGQKIGTVAREKHGAREDKADETMVSAIFGLLALIVAFTFSGASDRYDHRRELVAKEASTIGTAYASVDLLAEKDQPQLRAHFKKLVDERIVLYKNVTESNAYEARHDEFDRTRNRLWSDAVKSVKDTPFPEKLVSSQILPEISDMNDALDNQRLAMKMHPPRVLSISLFVLILIGAFVTGYNLGLTNKRDWLLISMFVTLMAGTFYITLNLEYPLIGFIGLEDFEMELLRLRRSM